MGKGGGGSAPQGQTVTQTNLPEYARPYFENLLQRGQAESYREYTPYQGQRIEGFAPMQEQAQQAVGQMQTPGQFGTATSLGTAAGLQALQAGQYAPTSVNMLAAQGPQLEQYQMGPAQAVSAQNVASPQMATAQTGFAPDLQMFQASGPGQVRGGLSSFTRPGAAQQFMSPYMQNVVDVQKQEAIRDAQKANLASNLAAARQGTYGGSRQLIAQTERERNLADQMAKIQATGSQAAYQQAQQGFEQEQARRLQAGLQTQQLGTQTGLANLQAALGVQQLGTQTGTQTALANLSAEQQANVQNLAAQLQTQGLNADQAMRAALANQQAGLTVGQQNLQALLSTQQLGAQQGMQAQLANQQALLEAQRLAEQSRQFGAGLGMQGAQAATQAAQTLGQLGTSQQAADLGRIQAQAAVGAEQRALEQQRLDMAYADFLRQRDYPMERLNYYSSLLRGVPVQLSSTQTAYAQPPSMLSQAAGLGLAGLGMYNLANK